MKKPLLLCILDGFGWVPDQTYGNAILAARTPNLDKLFAQYPRSEERRVGKECRSRWSPYH